jgi:hypothetical protein
VVVTISTTVCNIFTITGTKNVATGAGFVPVAKHANLELNCAFLL